MIGLHGRLGRYAKALALLAGIAAIPGPAMAQGACWLPMEARAYDIMMHTLYLAHSARACESLPGTAAGTAQTQLNGFLTANERIMSLDAEFFDIYYERQYGTRWESVMQTALDQDSEVLRRAVERRISADYCARLDGVVAEATDSGWEAFVAQAEASGWHGRAGLSPCDER